MAHFVCSNTLRNIDSKFMAHFVCSKVFSSAKICCPEKEFLVTRSDNDYDVGGDDDGDDGDDDDDGDDGDDNIGVGGDGDLDKVSVDDNGECWCR